jgi:hypothetical protein
MMQAFSILRTTTHTKCLNFVLEFINEFPPLYGKLQRNIFVVPTTLGGMIMLDRYILQNGISEIFLGRINAPKMYRPVV